MTGNKRKLQMVDKGAMGSGKKCKEMATNRKELQRIDVIHKCEAESSWQHLLGFVHKACLQQKDVQWITRQDGPSFQEQHEPPLQVFPQLDQDTFPGPFF